MARTKTELSHSDVMRIVRDTHPVVFDQTLAEEGRKVEKKLQLEILAGSGPEPIRKLGQGRGVVFHPRMTGKTANGVRISTTPDMVFKGDRFINAVEVKMRPKPNDYDLVQALFALAILPNGSQYGLYYNQSKRFMNVCELDLTDIWVGFGLLCAAAWTIIAGEKRLLAVERSWPGVQLTLDAVGVAMPGIEQTANEMMQARTQFNFQYKLISEKAKNILRL